MLRGVKARLGRRIDLRAHARHRIHVAVEQSPVRNLPLAFIERSKTLVSQKSWFYETMLRGWYAFGVQ